MCESDEVAAVGSFRNVTLLGVHNPCFVATNAHSQRFTLKNQYCYEEMLYVCQMP